MIEFIYKNKISSDFNIIILKSNHFYVPKRKIEQISIPGRTGDLIIEEKCTENFELFIECYVKHNDINGLINSINEWLESSNYETIHFNDDIKLKGYFLQLEINENINRVSKKITLIFTCYKENSL